MFLCRRMSGGREGELTMVDRRARCARSAAVVSAEEQPCHAKEDAAAEAAVH
jgi:hypothetical protein